MRAPVVLAAGLALALSVAARSAAAATYYASPDGTASDCLQKTTPCPLDDTVLGLLQAGDTLQLRAGTYAQQVHISASGTENAPVTVMGYPGETAIIDGGEVLPAGDWGVLLNVDGTYVVVRDIEVKDSLWMGVHVGGEHNSVVNVTSHGNFENGIILTGDYSLADGCHVYENCRSNENCVMTRGSWASGLSAARHPVGAVIRNSVSWHNWGEGISTYEATYTTIEDNVSYDNFSVNLYLSDATNILAQRNIIYATGALTCAPGETASQVGISIGSEAQEPSPSDITLVNNVVLNANRGFWFWAADADGLVNVHIAHNTFVNSIAGTNFDLYSDNPHSNTRIHNNIILQQDALPVCTVSATSGLTFSHNLWSSMPCDNAGGEGDVVGDPLLERTGTTGPGELTAEWFRIKAESPARDQGLVLSEVTDDIFKAARDATPDIGAHEYGAVPPQGGAGGTGAGGTPNAGGAGASVTGGSGGSGALSATPEDSGDTSGCGCRMVGSRPAMPAIASVLAVLLGVAARPRRRRAPAPRPSGWLLLAAGLCSGLMACGSSGDDGNGGSAPAGGAAGAGPSGAGGTHAGGTGASGGGGHNPGGGGAGGSCPGSPPYDVDHQEPSCLVPYPGSLWTKPLPADIMSHLAPSSDAIAQCTLTDCGAAQAQYYGESTMTTPGPDDWSSYPRYYGNADDPLYVLDDCGVDTGVFFHIPSGACLSRSADHGFFVWDQTSNKTLGLYTCCVDDWVCLSPCTATTEDTACPLGIANDACGVSDWTNGPAYAGGDHWNFGTNSLGNAGWSLHVRYKELMDGVILHPLLAVTKCTVGNVFPAPYGTYECSLSGDDPSTRPSTGSLLFLDYSDAEIDAMGLPAWQQPLVRAAARYGIYISDTSNYPGTSLALRFEGDGAYDLAGVTVPIHGWLENQGIPHWSNPSDDVYALSYLANLPDVLNHIHLADPCVAKAQAGLPDGCP